MRVLFVNRMASMQRGGGETFDLEISRRLESLGCEVTFLTGLPLFGGAKTPLTGRRGFTVRSPYTGWFPWTQVRGGWRLRLADFHLFERRAAAWAGRREADFDAIQVCELPTFVTEWKRAGRRVPVVMRLTAPDFYDASDAIGKADRVIASGDTLSKVRSGRRPDCADIPNGVDTELFRPHASGFRAEQGIGPDEFIILCVARFQSVKNHKLLVEAFRRVVAERPASRLVLAGSGPLERDVRERCAEAGVAGKVIFLGEVPFERLPDVYAAAEVKVIPSFYESFCFAALEAMATGLPLVVTETNWVPGLIERERGGRVVPVDGAAEMAAAMLEFARSPEARAKAGAFNRSKAVERFGWEASARKLLDLYGGLRVG